MVQMPVTNQACVRCYSFGNTACAVQACDVNIVRRGMIVVDQSVSQRDGAGCSREVWFVGLQVLARATFRLNVPMHANG